MFRPRKRKPPISEKPQSYLTRGVLTIRADRRIRVPAGRAERRKLATVLRTYVGRGPATEVLAGRVRRGDVRRLDAVVLLTDLRGFSRMTAIHSETETLTALVLYAEAVVAAVTARGGDVLKLMGDGILAIFPVESPGQAALACTAALAAVRAARADLALTSLEFVAVLNLGAVAYGNVGARERLDFTVIGDAVNVASRIEAHAKRLAVSVAMTAAVARHLDEPVHLLGQVELKDLPGSWELFGAGEPPYR
jgi:adenylate cyclase